MLSAGEPGGNFPDLKITEIRAVFVGYRDPEGQGIRILDAVIQFEGKRTFGYQRFHIQAHIHFIVGFVADTGEQ